MFEELKNINEKPGPFEFYTARDLWTDEYTSQKMLEYHLDESIDASSRNIKFIEESVSWIVSLHNLDSDSDLIDFGCGPGLYTNRFAEKGINVTGVDFSKRSIEYAQKIAAELGLDVDYIHQNYLDFTTQGKFDVITMIMCDYCALSPNQRRIMLGKFRRLLKAHGKIILDVHSLNYFNKKEEFSAYELNQLDHFWSAEDYYCFVNCFKYNPEKVTLDKYTIIEASGRKRVVYNWLQCFCVTSLKDEFERNGLRIDNVYGDVAGRDYDPQSPEFAVVVRKK
ncbi:class I SAM-dependent methyltransferase [uncultured Methanobacterium sp.]|uniref:SAM-dependent methyltransferase n=1 Tax=uncultured Methanobacterium sp. TaxID=176306 RepID=UPI002AA8F6D6|nr:class I SAM-dependent methyltransferase [uncultured Methanobacterium sp.]